jgi:hypothetical protein
MTLYNISARMTWDATMNRDLITAGTTYEMWRTERLWNVGVLQSVRLSNIVTFGQIFITDLHCSFVARFLNISFLLILLKNYLFDARAYDRCFTSDFNIICHLSRRLIVPTEISILGFALRR